MKILKCALCVFTMVAIFSSCSKQESVTGTDYLRSIAISINNDTTKAVDDPVTGNVSSEYSNLYIYLLAGTKVVSCDAITDAAAVTTFKNSGKSYDNISSSIDNVLIVANVKAGDALPTVAGTDITAIKAFPFAIASQQPDAANSENTKANGLKVTMIGESGLTDLNETTSEGYAKMKAAVTLSPVVARVEISKELQPGEGIHSIEIKNVYLNTYYSDYSFQAGSLVNKGTVIADYASNLQTVGYADEVKAATKADAYHVFANGTTTAMPHIILEVSGFYKDAANGQGVAFADRYLTITKFSNSDAATKIDKIAANSIYKIDLSKLTVPASVLDPQPEAGRVSLEVSVDVKAWTVVNVSPEL